MSSGKPGRFSLAPLLLIPAVMAGNAFAQEAAPVPVPDLTRPVLAPEKMVVSQRGSPEYDPLSLRVGSFDVLPVIDLGERFDSNIYGSSEHALSDAITVVQPIISARSDWGGGNAIGLYAMGDVEKYLEHTTENVNNVIVEADGRLEILTGESLELRSGYQIQHESRYAADSQAAVQYAGGGDYARYPTQYSVTEGTVSYVHSRGVIGFSLDAGIQSYSFKNEPTFNGGLAINSDRDRNDYSLTPRLSYELAPGYQAFIQASATRNQYNSVADATPEHLDRRSTDYALAAGSQFDLGDILVGELYVGYFSSRYDDSRLSSVNGPYFAGSLLWNVTKQTSATAKLSRWVEETILIGSPGTWQTEVEGKVEHEVLRPMLVTAEISFIKLNYIDIGRNDDLLGVTAGLKWRFNRLLSCGVRGGWQQRWSNQSFNDLKEGTALADIKMAF